MNKFCTFRVLVLLILLCSFSVILAQDEPETTEEAPVVVVSPIGAVIEPTSDPVEIANLLFQSLGLVILAFGSGVAMGGLTIGIIIVKLKNDVPLQNSIEKLAISLPPDTLKDLREFFLTVRDVGNIGVAVTDGKPNVPMDQQPAST